MLRICVSLLATLGMGCSFVVTPSHGQPIIFQEPPHLHHHSISAPAIMSESLSPPAIRLGRNAGATPSIPVRKQEQTQLFQLVEEGDEEARRAYFLKREKALHKDFNGANSGPVHAPEFLIKEAALHDDFNGANSGPQHVPEPTKDGSSEVRRRRSASPRLEAEVVYAAPSEAVVEAGSAAPKASTQVQSARDEYRKNRFAGSSILKALALAGAKPQPLSEGGSYAG